MPVHELYGLIRAVSRGELEDVVEKLDGQNFTFTLVNDEVRFLGKGCSKHLVSLGGLDRAGIVEKHAAIPSVRDAFTFVHGILNSAFRYVLPAEKQGLFRSGGFAISSEVLFPECRNVIMYGGRSLCLLDAVSVDDISTLDDAQRAAFDDVCSRLELLASQGLTRGCSILRAPRLEPTCRDDAAAQALEHALDLLCTRSCVGRDATMGDVTVGLVLNAIKGDRACTELGAFRPMVARRLALGDKSAVGMKELPSGCRAILKRLERERVGILAAANVNLEAFFQGLGALALRTYAPVLSRHDDAAFRSEMRGFISRLDLALEDPARRLVATEKQLQHVMSARSKLQDVGLIANAEGIVFTWMGQRRKLVGAFSALNRLLGCFKYGSGPAGFADGW